MSKILPKHKLGRPSSSSTDDSAVESKDTTTSQPLAVSPSSSYPSARKTVSAEKGSDSYLRVKAESTSTLMPKTRDPKKSIFSGSQHFITNDPIFHIPTQPSPNSSFHDVVSLLSQRSNMKAGLHSAAREPPPRCHKGTRHNLLLEIILNIESDYRPPLLWLCGPAGAGKSAVAQSLAELWESHYGLCATFFFSGTDGRNDSTHVLPTLAYQLAILLPTYRHHISSLLTEDPTILEQSLSVQFQKLIWEPLSYREGAGSKPILFLLDGFEECHGHNFQQRLITLITDTDSRRLPFIWVITSRPERLLCSTFSRPDILDKSRTINIGIDAPDAEIHSYLVDRFSRIREEYIDAFSEDKAWPTSVQLEPIVTAASGSLSIASAVASFVENGQRHNPKTRLEICLANLNNFSLQENPLQPLHDIYRGILEKIHPQDLRRVLQILYMRPDIPAQIIANFLFLDQAEFYGVLHNLYSVLDIPEPRFAATVPIRAFHNSFYHYLRSMVGYGCLGVRMMEIVTDIEAFCIRWCEIWKGLSDEPSKDVLLSYLRWPADPVQFSEVLGLVSEQIGQIQSSKVGRAVPRIYEDLRRLVARRSVSSHEDWSERGDKLDPLHLLYSGILRTIPQESRPLIRVLLLSRPLPAQSSANLLFLDQASFYENIWKLHLVLDVPDLEDAERLPLRLRSSHEAFGSYLDHVVNEYDVLAHIEKCYNKWCDLWGKLGSDPALFELQECMPWFAESCYGDILEFVSKELWKIWCSEIDENTPRFYKEFHRFDFAAHYRTGLFSERFWPDPHQPAVEVTTWLCQMNRWQHGQQEFNILRSGQKFLTDRLLFREYGYLINYGGMKEIDFHRLDTEPEWNYMCLSSKVHHHFEKIRETLSNPLPMYFLLGYDMYTCLVIAHRPTLGIRQFFREAFQQMRTMFPNAISGTDAWPTTNDLDLIISVSATSQELFVQGPLPSLARSIVAFVGNPEYADPVGRLKQVLEILGHHSDQTTILDTLRSQSLTDIPSHLRPTADQIFAFLTCYGARPHHHSPFARHVSLFLDLAEEEIKKVLGMSNLILSSRPLPIPMGAVADFDITDLLDYCMGEGIHGPEDSRDAHSSLCRGSVISPQTWSKVALRYIRWWDRSFAAGLNPAAKNNPSEARYKWTTELRGETSSRAARTLGESPSDNDHPEDQSAAEDGMSFQQDLLAGGHWIAFNQITKEKAADVVTGLRESDNFFVVIASACGFTIPHYDEMAQHFSLFINKLYSYQTELKLESIIRLDRNSNIDDELLAKWQRLGDPCRKATFPIDFTQATCYFTTPIKNWPPEMFSKGLWYYFWMGHDRNTCLVTFQIENEDKSVTFSGELGESEFVAGQANRSVNEQYDYL